MFLPATIALVMFKKIVQRKLENYVKKYFQAHPEVKLVVVAGSVGKTTTRQSIATILSERYRVAMSSKNHNTEISVPMAILGIELPGKLHSPLAWLQVFRAAKLRIKWPTGVDVIVQEIGVDHPGEMQIYSRYLKPDIALVTAVSPEHMEYFKTIEAVATEELSVGNFSKEVLINRDDIDGRFAEFQQNPNFSTYGTSGASDYHFEATGVSPRKGMTGVLTAAELNEPIALNVSMVGEHSVRPVVGAVAVAIKLGLTTDQILSGLASIKPVSGRMNPMEGIGGTLVLDDTYNSSPAAASAALQTLYKFDTEPQRIAVLGSMNELGEVSAAEHEKIGQLCNPDLLAWVVVVGEDAANYLAPAARQRGCQVKIARDAIEAGQFVRSVAEEGSVILVKGSQGGVYLEETVKLLVDINEHPELVRQSAEWLKIKQEHFDRFADSKS